MSLIAELKRRNVFRVGVAYAIVGWLLLEVASVVFPGLHLPDWTLTFLIVLVVAGFPLALIVAWAFEMTPEGLKRESAVDPAESARHLTGRKLDFAIIGLLVIAVVFLVVDNYVLEPEVGKDGEIRSIAVLPFNDLSPGDGRKLLADGIAEAIIHVLAQHQELLVTARTSSFYFRDKDMTATEIGRALGVEALLEGSVQIAGDRLRVNSQLIRTSDQTHIWSNVYESPLGDIFRVQDTIATTVRDLVLDSGKSEMPTYVAERPKVEVYELVLEARHLLDEASVAATERAVRVLRLAVDLSPNYADAHAWLGMALRYQSGQSALEVDYDTMRFIREELQTAVNTALALDPNNALAILQQGELSQKTGDGAGYENAAKKAIEVAPNDPRVLIWAAALEAQHLNFDLAREYVRRARTVDPSDFSVLGSYIWRFCDFEEFTSIVDAQLATYTTSTRTALEIRQQALFCDKRYSEAFATNVQLAKLDTEPNSALWALYTLAELGNDEALSLLDAAHKLLPGWFNNSTEDASIFFEEVVDQRRKTYQRHRQSEFFYPWFFLIAQAKLLIQTDDLQGAEHSLSRARELWENYYAFHDGRHIQYQTLAIYGYSAWLAARRGDTEEATKISRELLSHLESRNLTEWSESRGELSELPLLVLTLNGKTEKAVEWIRLAAADNWLYFQPVLTSPVFADFREYPEVSETLSDLLENRKAVLADISTSGIPEAANPTLLFDRIERLADISDYRRAQTLAEFDGDLQGAAGVYLAAIKNNPEDVSGLNTAIRFAYRLGRTETASRLAELLVRANIENASSHFQAAYSYLCLGRDDDAIDSLRKSLAADPDWEGGHRWMAIALMFSGNELAAMEEVNLEESEVERLVGEALVNYAMGNQHESDTALRKLIDDHGLRRAASISYIYAFRNEIDESFRWLDTHFEKSQGPMYDLTSQPLFANLHNDPRWTELLKRLGRDPAEMAKIDFDVDSVLQENKGVEPIFQLSLCPLWCPNQEHLPSLKK